MMSATITAGPPMIMAPLLSTTWPLRHEMPPMGALPTAPGLARAESRYILTKWCLPEFIEVTELVSSELVTNAVLASRMLGCHQLVYEGDLMPLVRLSFYSNRAYLVIAVYDRAPEIPRQRHAAGDEESGRGLELIASFGTWSCIRTADGKITRARLDATRLDA